MTARPNAPLTGILWMIVTGLFFVGVTVVVKIVGDALPPQQSAFLRFAFGLVFVLPALRGLARAPLTRRHLRLFAVRGAAHTVAVMLWFYAMTQITLAEVTAMNYLAPIYVTIGAALFLGERLAIRRLLAVAAALIGALLILRPGFRELAPGHFAMLGTALMFGISYLFGKKLSSELGAGLIVAMLSVIVTAALLPFALAVWVPPTPAQLALLFVVAFFATAGHYTMTLAFAAAPVSVTQPVTFLQLIWSVTIGALFFAEPVDGWVVAGGVLIVAALSFIAWREHVISRRAITPGVNETKT